MSSKKRHRSRTSTENKVSKLEFHQPTPRMNVSECAAFPTLRMALLSLPSTAAEELMAQRWMPPQSLSLTSLELLCGEMSTGSISGAGDICLSNWSAAAKGHLGPNPYLICCLWKEF